MHNNFIEHYNYMHALPMQSLRSSWETKLAATARAHVYLAKPINEDRNICCLAKFRKYTTIASQLM